MDAINAAVSTTTKRVRYRDFSLFGMTPLLQKLGVDGRVVPAASARTWPGNCGQW